MSLPYACIGPPVTPSSLRSPAGPEVRIRSGQDAPKLRVGARPRVRRRL